MSSTRSPEDLCERLGLQPTEDQRELMFRFHEGQKLIKQYGTHDATVLRATALCALWQLLRYEGSRVIVLTSDLPARKHFRDFLESVTTRIDPGVSSVCRWTNTDTLKVGEHGRLQFVTNNATRLAGIYESIMTWIVLGASSSEMRFHEAHLAAQAACSGSRHQMIELW